MSNYLVAYIYENKGTTGFGRVVCGLSVYPKDTEGIGNLEIDICKKCKMEHISILNIVKLGE